MRKKIHLTMVLCLVLSFMIISIPSTIYACSCAEIPTVEEELERSKAVFTGNAITIKEQRHLDGSITKSVLFGVTKTWKGVSESQVIITTGLGGGDCGYEFEQGKEYLVYANNSSMYGEKDDLVTIICDRTNELITAQEDLALLGQGKIPTEQVNLKGELRGISLYVWGIAIAIVGIVVSFVWKKFKN